MDASEYEMLFIDDCSTDGTYELTQRVCAEQPNWHSLFFERNSGSPLALATTVSRLLRGDYIYFLDCDDELLPNALSKLLELAQRTDACIVRSKALLLRMVVRASA